MGTSRYGGTGSFSVFAALAVLASAAFAAGDAPVRRKGIYPKPPEAAVRALQITIGTPFSTGYVFINGKYEPPPYRVERYGNTIRINGVQVTKQIVPWVEFARTQKNFTEKAAAGAAPERPAAAEAPSEDGTAAAESLENLFDLPPGGENSRPAQPKPAPEPQKAKNAPQAKEEPFTFDGPFVHNEKTQAYLERINTLRTKMDTKLRSGGYIFFGTRYSPVAGNATMAGYMIDRLPEIMRKSTGYDQFVSDCYRAGLQYLPKKVLEDLYRNRYDHIMLTSRVKKDAAR